MSLAINLVKMVLLTIRGQLKHMKYLVLIKYSDESLSCNNFSY